MTGHAPVEPTTDLGELFRLECETHATSLLDGLLELERRPGDSSLSDKLMRAAHSLKGAARVVGLNPAVDLAHSMEDALTWVKREQRDVTPEVIEALLHAADAFVRLGQKGSEPDAEELFAVAEQVRAVRASPATGAPSPSTKASGSTFPAQGSAFPAQGSAQGSTFPVQGSTRGSAFPTQGAAHGGISAGAPALPAPVLPALSPAPSGFARESDGDRVLRVRASHMSQIVGLAGEVLVESRGLRPLVQAQHRLRTRQTSLVDLITELHQALGAPPADDPIGVRIAEIRSRVAECRSLLGKWQEEFDEHARRAEELTLRLHREATRSQLRPLSDCLGALPRLVRDLSKRLDKQVDFAVTGAEVPIDRDIQEKIEAPLNHILRNAVDHGIESPDERAHAGKSARGSIRIDARHHAGTLRISIADDGRGIDPDRIRERIARHKLLSEADAALLDEAKLYDYLFLPGFSTADAVTETSGRGVGMDVVQSVMHEIGGSVHLSSEKGRGTSFELTLPISRSVIRAVIVRIAGAPYAFPLNRLDRLIEVPREALRVIESRQYVVVDGQNVALIPTSQVLELRQAVPAMEQVRVLVVSSRAHRFGFVVDAFVDEQDLVVRTLDPRLGRISDISAAAVLADGTPALIVDVDDLIRSVLRLQEVTHIEKLAPEGVARPPRQKRVIIIDDSVSVRELERGLLVDRGYDVSIAVDGASGWAAVRDGVFDLAVVDIDMPRIDGLSLARSIKQDSRLKHLQIFMVSYRDSDEDRTQALAAGVDEFMSKATFQNRAFLDAVARLIGAPVEGGPDAP